MTDKERQVLELIKMKPYLSQQEMAKELNIPRPTLANMISGLIKKGEIVGRAYILPNKGSIVVVGGANVDRKFRIQDQVKFGTSNPASVSVSIGGVARNIAENLGRLGNNVKLITAIGQDQDAELILQSSRAYIDTQSIEVLPSEKTGSYTAVLDDKGELILGMANMSIYDSLLPSILEKNEATITNSKCIIADLNCPKETIEYLQSISIQKEIPFTIIPVSSPKMKNMPTKLEGITYFICNLEEAEKYLNRKIESDQDFEAAVKQLLELGAKHVVLTRGSKGVFIGSELGIKQLGAVKVDEVVDVTGAGDAFVGATLHGVLNGATFEEAVHLGLYNASKTLESDKTVRQDLSVEDLNNWRNL